MPNEGGEQRSAELEPDPGPSLPGADREPLGVVSVELFARAFHDMPVPLSITRERDGLVLDVNDALLEMFGYRREDVIGRTTIELDLWVDERQAIVDAVDAWGVASDITLHWRVPRGIVITRSSYVRIDFRGEPALFGIFIDETEKVQTLEALQASESRYRTIVREATDAMITLGPDGRYADANEATCRMVGYTLDELLTMSPRDLADPAELSRQRVDLALVAAGQTLRTERKLRRKDGTAIWVELTSTPMADGSAHSIMRDVSDRKAAEERADRLLRLYAATADIDRAISRIADAETLFREACRIAVEVGGFVLVWVGMLHNDRDGRAIEIVASAGRSVDQLFTTRVPLDREDGTMRPGRQAITEDRPVLTHYDEAEALDRAHHGLVDERLRASLLIPLHVSDEAVGILGIYDSSPDAFGAAENALLERIAEDVSYRLEAIEREKAHQALRAERDRLAEAVDQASDGMMIIGPMGVIVYANKGFCEMIGRTRDSIVGSSAADILRFGVRRPDLANAVRAAGMAQRPFSGEFEVVRPDGSPGWVSLATTPVRDETARMVNVVAIMRDVTHEHQLEQQLRQAQKMEAVGQLAGGIAHDFNNLLTVIRGYADLARAQLTGSPVATDVAAIDDAAARAADLTRQLLQFARQTPVARMPLDINRIVENLAPMLRRLIGDDVILDVRTASTCSTVAADSSQIEQAIVNLVVNAKDAMTNGGRISIETADVVLDPSFGLEHPDIGQGPRVLLTVADDGSGIDPEIIDRIFDPFFTTKEQGKGTGLGLSMVFGAIKAADGGILVDSARGKGTTFRIYLPCGVQPDAPAGDPGTRPGIVHVAAGEAGGGRTILIIEDEDAVRSFTRRVLERHGYRVLEATNGPEAIVMAEAYPEDIAIVVTDVVMPGMTGPHAVEAIRGIRPDLPAVFMSGYAERGVGDLAASRSAYVQKPFESRQLLDTIARLLGEAED